MLFYPCREHFRITHQYLSSFKTHYPFHCFPKSNRTFRTFPFLLRYTRSPPITRTSTHVQILDFDSYFRRSLAVLCPVLGLGVVLGFQLVEHVRSLLEDVLEYLGRPLALLLAALGAVLLERLGDALYNINIFV